MTVYNFCAGPAKLPEAVMNKAQSEFVNWNNTGCSVMELSHRSKEFIAVYDSAIASIKQLLGLSDEYTVLFMHGGGRGQFSAVPLNLLNSGQANYVTTGSWSQAAVEEAKKFGAVTEQNTVEIVGGKKQVISMSDWQVSQDSAYVHYCPNETVDGIEIFEQPSFDVPVVADMSSTIFSREIDSSKFDLIYAGAQKNIGPSGLSLVVVKKELLARSQETVPSVFNYKLTHEKDSMFNTPPTYAIYLAKLVFDWLLENGGVAAQEVLNKKKADLLYQTIDNSSFYSNNIASANRSRMNVPFFLANSELDSTFLAQAENQGLVALKGHRIVGGMRASIYNAMPIEGVKALTEFMQEFERTHG
ncbi:3-phosphoserine/phosphohydroxythreonine transaminase [Psychrosphaera sp. 1_MG-2023]|uniref:3-phosphoserine/phosphohydroxythreonine transaminase n=1 Tax=Psychrosphaera sp. 1_MG-2023 TaxID=3062643 RepID=UPI0026E18438|nr:3-phosphoserine/phosphohydroxythreonine transaminase [Psychrosphaera sp. 1_MG-2023]MDO6718025.1 3-phosphoserine/phosphohydroxythreonine transaminase [Psychrosphaera sp. 1_MG-2023]